MNQALQQKISEYYAKLPQKAQEMFARMDWMENLKTISVKYNLTDMQIQTLGTETTLMLLGIIHANEYEGNLMTELAVPREVADKIVKDVNDTILKDFRLMLTEAYTANTMEAAEKEYGAGKTLGERFESLPYEVRDAIENSDYQKKLYDIASKQKLSIEQMGKLENLTNKVMLGIIHPDEYTKKIAEDLAISMDASNALVLEINNQIMGSIRTALKNHTENPLAGTPERGQGVREIEDEMPVPKPPVLPLDKGEMPKAEGVRPLPNLPLSKGKEDIMQSAGIEVMKEKIPVAPTEHEITEKNMATYEKTLAKSGVGVIEEKVFPVTPNIPSSKESRNELIRDIENPPVIPSSIIAQKLGKIGVANTPSNPSSAPTPLSGDKYKEAI